MNAQEVGQMYIRRITIEGLRGFADAQTLDLAIPDGRRGSGMTMIVGPNNGGKSTIIEAFRAMASPGPSSFSVGKRNKTTDKRVNIKMENENKEIKELKTLDLSGGSETKTINWHMDPSPTNVLVLPSRRYFSPYFHKEERDRQGYALGMNGMRPRREQAIEHFFTRLFSISNNPQRYNDVLLKVLSRPPSWHIELSDAGQYYISYGGSGDEHDGDGIGDGLLSLMVIIDALYDAPEGHIVVIDEPELSLHPSLQRKLAVVFCDFAQDHQLIFATHSPYFVDFEALYQGAKIARVSKRDGRCVINMLSDEALRNMRNFRRNFYNPHVLGLDAREVFFLDDRVILVEGQDDVVHYARILRDIDMEIQGSFFGWGVGGAPCMPHITRMLHELGFEKVVGILDQDKADIASSLGADYPDYKFVVIPADDVRTKPETKARPRVEGLLNEDYQLKSEYQGQMAQLFDEINGYYARDNQ
jgi:predicted ATPase